MQRLGGFIKTNMKSKSVLARQINAGLVVEFVNEQIKTLWGKIGKDYAKAISLKDKILKINCGHSVMAQELTFKKQRIVDLVNEKFGSGTIIRITIVQKGIEKEKEM
jgi:hypothetical protein